MVLQARKNDADALMPYGKNIKEVVKRIRQMKWFGYVLIGLLGVMSRLGSQRSGGRQAGVLVQLGV